MALGRQGAWARYAGMLVPSSTAISMVVMVPSSAPAKLVTTAAFYWYWHEYPGTMAAAGDPAALGQLLRSRRERLAPADVGLPARTRRRTRGLRREEVAMLASVSATYYTFLEQGRPVRPSLQVLDALAAALRMSAAERRYLHVLAYGPDGVSGLLPAGAAPPEELDPALGDLVQRPAPAPAPGAARP